MQKKACANNLKNMNLDNLSQNNANTTSTITNFRRHSFCFNVIKIPSTVSDMFHYFFITWE